MPEKVAPDWYLVSGVGNCLNLNDSQNRRIPMAYAGIYLASYT